MCRQIANPSVFRHLNKKAGELFLRLFIERLAATYSRRTYRTTTIGKTAFDGRVRNGIGSDHSFMATKNGSQKAEVGRQSRGQLRLTKFQKSDAETNPAFL